MSRKTAFLLPFLLWATVCRAQPGTEKATSLQSVTATPQSVGADPTGLTDATAAWQSMLDSGRSIECEGTYSIRGTLRASGDVRIAARGRCLLRADAPMDTLLWVGGSKVGERLYSRGWLIGVELDGRNKLQNVLTLGNTAVGLMTFGFRVANCDIHNGNGAGVSTLNNVWGLEISATSVSMNGKFGVDISGGDNAGETISITDATMIFNNSGGGLHVRVPGRGGASVSCRSSSLDYNAGWALLIEGGVVDISACHIEQPDHWLSNAGLLSVEGSFFTNGGKSQDVPGYLIENHNRMTVTGGMFINTGSGKLVSPAAKCVLWLGTATNDGADSNACKGSLGQ